VAAALVAASQAQVAAVARGRAEAVA
jgi:hypothetical protein